MVARDAYNLVLEYLKNQPSSINTFRLSRELGIDRYKILNIIKKLEGKQAVEIKRGKVVFLRFPETEKKVVKKIIEVRPKKKLHKTKIVTQKRIKLREKLRALETLHDENKQLREKVLKLGAGIKRQTDIENIIKEKAEYIENLKKRIKRLQRKASASPKIIRKIVIKKVPIKVKKKAKPRKFKAPKFNITLLKNIQKLRKSEFFQKFRKPEFLEQRIRMEELKFNFAGLNKNIQQLRIPRMLKKGG